MWIAWKVLTNGLDRERDAVVGLVCVAMTRCVLVDQGKEPPQRKQEQGQGQDETRNQDQEPERSSVFYVKIALDRAWRASMQTAADVNGWTRDEMETGVSWPVALDRWARWRSDVLDSLSSGSTPTPTPTPTPTWITHWNQFDISFLKRVLTSTPSHPMWRSFVSDLHGSWVFKPHDRLSRGRFQSLASLLRSIPLHMPTITPLAAITTTTTTTTSAPPPRAVQSCHQLLFCFLYLARHEPTTVSVSAHSGWDERDLTDAGTTNVRSVRQVTETTETKASVGLDGTIVSDGTTGCPNVDTRAEKGVDMDTRVEVGVGMDTRARQQEHETTDCAKRMRMANVVMSRLHQVQSSTTAQPLSCMAQWIGETARRHELAYMEALRAVTIEGGQTRTDAHFAV